MQASFNLSMAFYFHTKNRENILQMLLYTHKFVWITILLKITNITSSYIYIHTNDNLLIMVNTLPFRCSFYPYILGGTHDAKSIFCYIKWLQFQIWVKLSLVSYIIISFNYFRIVAQLMCNIMLPAQLP